MSKLVKVKLTYDGPAKLRCSPEAKALVKELADAAVERLGEGYKATVRVEDGDPRDGKHPRAVAKVSAIWAQTKKDNAEHNTILKALK